MTQRARNSPESQHSAPQTVEVGLVELSVFTGLRQSEALGLTWDRVDRARGVILLQQTKNGRPREVPLNDAADAVLARRGAKDGAGLVFASRNWNRYRTAWEGAIARAKLTGLHWHDLRHTFASWAVQRRVSLYELKELLGHSSLAMVTRYAHLAPGHLRQAASALDNVLSSDSKEKATEPVPVVAPEVAVSSSRQGLASAPLIEAGVRAAKRSARSMEVC